MENGASAGLESDKLKVYETSARRLYAITFIYTPVKRAKIFYSLQSSCVPAITYLPSSSTSAGAVPSFLASSNSFFFLHSSRDCFFGSSAFCFSRSLSENGFATSRLKTLFFASISLSKMLATSTANFKRWAPIFHQNRLHSSHHYMSFCKTQ